MTVPTSSPGFDRPGDTAPDRPGPAASAPEILVEARGIGARVGGRWRVRDVDLTLRRGEIVTLIGPNGGGKSTTAKLILGVLRSDAGSVRRHAGLRVGYVPQKLDIDASLPLSVGRLMRLTRRHDDAAVARALAAVGADRLADRPVQTLSGGEFQRVLLARAIVGGPDLLVLDEPVQGVDYASEIALYELIADLRRALDCGILLISHDLHIVMAQTDRVLCLDGHVCCSGTPGTVGADPSYRRLFGLGGADALGVYRHRHDHVHLPDGRVVAAGDAPAQEGRGHG